MTMKIRVSEAKIREADSIPNADGYLVQHHFKNSFKDFQMSKCVFIKDLSELSTVFEPEGGLRGPAAFYIESNGKRKSSLKKAIEFIEASNFEAKHGYEHIFVSMAYTVKIWPMIDKQPPAKAFSVYVTPEGKALTMQEYAAWVREWVKKVEDNFPELVVSMPSR